MMTEFVLIIGLFIGIVIYAGELSWDLAQSPPEVVSAFWSWSTFWPSMAIVFLFVSLMFGVSYLLPENRKLRKRDAARKAIAARGGYTNPEKNNS